MAKFNEKVSRKLLLYKNLEPGAEQWLFYSKEGGGDGHSVKSDIQSWTFGWTIKLDKAEWVWLDNKAKGNWHSEALHPRCIQHDHHQRETNKQTDKYLMVTDIQKDTNKKTSKQANKQI